MKLYRALIKPQISHPNQHYEPVCRDLEQDGKWYAEEEEETIKGKYQHLENTFEKVTFDVRYEIVQAIPVKWLEEQREKEVCGTYHWWIYQVIINKWQKEQEVQDGKAD